MGEVIVMVDGTNNCDCNKVKKIKASNKIKWLEKVNKSQRIHFDEITTIAVIRI
jgi:hypothetical protein